MSYEYNTVLGHDQRPPWESTNCLVRADASVSEQDIGQSLTCGFASHISQIGPTYLPSFFPLDYSFTNKPSYNLQFVWQKLITSAIRWHY